MLRKAWSYEWRQKKIGQALISNYLSDLLVPRPGVEPGRIAPLVFETSASTDSAIWAIAGAKVQIKIEIANFLVTFFLKKLSQGRKKLKMCFISPILY